MSTLRAELLTLADDDADAYRAFIAALAGALAPGGLMVLSCPNRTPQSKLLLVEGARTSIATEPAVTAARRRLLRSPLPRESR